MVVKRSLSIRLVSLRDGVHARRGLLDRQPMGASRANEAKSVLVSSAAPSAVSLSRSRAHRCTVFRPYVWA